jgi:hypothetical protein
MLVTRFLGLMMRLTCVSILAFGIMIWAVAAIRLGGFTTANLCDPEMIRRENPVRLVSPDWVSPHGNILSWLDAETYARMALVFVASAVAMLWIMRKHFAARRLGIVPQ